MLRRNRAPIRRTVRVHTVNDRTLEGVLVSVGEHYELAQAKLIRGTNEATELVGTTYVPASTVEFLQTTGGAA